MRTIAAILAIAVLTGCAPKPQAKQFSPVQYSQMMTDVRNYRIK